MPHRPAPRVALWFSGLAALTLALAGAPTSSAWAAKHKKPAKAWPAKKSSTKSDKKAAPEKSDDADEDKSADKGASAQKGDDDDDEKEPAAAKPEPKAKPAAKSKVKMDDDADGDEKEASKSSDEDEGDDDEKEAPVVRKKAKKHAAAEETEGGAAVALALDLGSRGVHRTFDFNDPRYYTGTTSPGRYSLPAGPVPFLHFGLYPLAFAGRDGLANLGLVGRYERLVATKGGDGQTTVAQEFDVGLRGRLPLGGGELGLTGTYGQQSFMVSSTDLPPSMATTVPNVEYSFVRVGADGEVALGDVTLGAHVGTRFVPKTGNLGTWFGKTKTTSLEAGISGAYKLTPTFSLVAGVDFLRYAFAFTPPTDNGIVAGGAVDQYISGYGALRISISGS